jgi:hypothetical protein
MCWKGIDFQFSWVNNSVEREKQEWLVATYGKLTGKKFYQISLII